MNSPGNWIKMFMQILFDFYRICYQIWHFAFRMIYPSSKYQIFKSGKTILVHVGHLAERSLFEMRQRTNLYISATVDFITSSSTSTVLLKIRNGCYLSLHSTHYLVSWVAKKQQFLLMMIFLFRQNQFDHGLINNDLMYSHEKFMQTKRISISDLFLSGRSCNIELIEILKAIELCVNSTYRFQLIKKTLGFLPKI